MARGPKPTGPGVPAPATLPPTGLLSPLVLRREPSPRACAPALSFRTPRTPWRTGDVTGVGGTGRGDVVRSPAAPAGESPTRRTLDVNRPGEARSRLRRAERAGASRAPHRHTTTHPAGGRTPARAGTNAARGGLDPGNAVGALYVWDVGSFPGVAVAGTGASARSLDVLLHVESHLLQRLHDLAHVLASPGLEVDDDLDVAHRDVGEGPPVGDLQHVGAAVGHDAGERGE